MLTANPIGSSAHDKDQFSSADSWSPHWAKDLVIYNIATKAFTSPNGPESGTFESLQTRLAYLQELGITGIWLSGHSLGDAHQQFNVWTQYACIEPDKLDPSLGTPEQFKAMIDEAHRRGIKIFLDIVTHGVMPESSLVRNHPEWFRGGTFRMADYDWNGGHTDLDDWWVKTWTDAVTKYGVDGFRLDLGFSGQQKRVDLWARIRENARAADHPIVIFPEGDEMVKGVTDFSQNSLRISGAFKPAQLNPLLVNDIPGLYDHLFGRAGTYTVEIEYDDGTKAQGSTAGSGTLGVHLVGLAVDRASAGPGDEVFGVDPSGGQALPEQVVRADGIADAKITLDNVEPKGIENITVVADDGYLLPGRVGSKWTLRRTGIWSDVRPLAMEGQAPRVSLYVPRLNYSSTTLLSAIDTGWWEDDENPYVAQGSRALVGYSLLFTPRIPIFMAGEEFDATFHALPGLSADSLGHKNPGKGHILLGAMLDWNELSQPRHRAMFEDVKRMLRIRKRESALLAAQVRGDIEPNLAAVPHQSDVNVPVPYIRWNKSSAIIVMGNRRSDVDANLELAIPLERLGWRSEAKYRVTDLWRDERSKTYSGKQLIDFPYVVERDKSPGGGVGLLKIEVLQ